MIVFLDIDGVLHPEPCYDKAKLFCRRSVFESAIADCLNVEIVISSTWRHNHSVDEIRSFFSPHIAQKIVGATPNWRDLPGLQEVVGQYPRQIEVEGYLRQNGRPWEDWVALDDRSYLFRPFLKQLILCDPTIGLSADNASTLRSIVGNADLPRR